MLNKQTEDPPGKNRYGFVFDFPVWMNVRGDCLVFVCSFDMPAPPELNKDLQLLKVRSFCLVCIFSYIWWSVVVCVSIFMYYFDDCDLLEELSFVYVLRILC